jgi:hypothetical protein
VKRLCCSVSASFFASVFGGLALATLFLSSAVPGAVSEQRDWAMAASLPQRKGLELEASGDSFFQY